MDKSLNDRLAEIAKTHIKEHFAEWKEVVVLPTEIEDKGEVWAVMFNVPEGVLGGPVVVEIEKKTFVVKRVFFYQ